MTASVTIHEATGLKFRSGEHSHNSGGWLKVTIPHSDSILDEDEIFIHTTDPAVLDHFRDIERVANGAIGSLRAEPTEEPIPTTTEAPSDGNPNES